MAITKRAYPARRVSSFRSGLEEANMSLLKKIGVRGEYEAYRILYTLPETEHKYTPDFVLPNGIIIETKGMFDYDDRKKHLAIKEIYPELDLRFVFSSSKTKIRKGSPTSYGDWCEKNGFLYADKLIPVAWLKEPKHTAAYRHLVPAKKTKN